MKLRSRGLWLLLATLFGLSSCALVQPGMRGIGPTLADLSPADLPDPNATPEPIPATTWEEVEASYRAALAATQSPHLRQKIETRLADIEMERSEYLQVTEPEHRAYFTESIALYSQLIDAQEAERPGFADERLVYRLAKAYALDGRMQESDAALAKLVAENPSSTFAAEANFRQAEQAYSDGHYARAANLYGRVAALDGHTPFHMNARYMLGWAQFKNNQFEQSVTTFTRVLDGLVGDADSLAALTGSAHSLAEDTLRVMGITFSYMDGAQSVTQLYDQLGERNYQHLMYSQLGEFYLDQERYRDAADTYQHYVRRFPDSDRSPQFAVLTLDIYQQAGFGDEMLPAKEAFVANYGINSLFWATRDEEGRALVEPYLKTYLNEISSYYHAEAQRLAAVERAHEEQRAAGQTPSQEPVLARSQYLQAALYYEQYLQTFPQDPRRAELTYLMAESQYAAGELVAAVEAYKQVAYEWLDPGRGAAAGYAMILVLQDLAAQTRAEGEPDWQAQQIKSAIDFADYYPYDPRATAVLTQAAQNLFDLGQAERALPLAARITVWEPEPTPELRKTAWLILAHHQFDEADYAVAEKSYSNVLSLLAEDDPQQSAILQRIAASIYRSAEQMLAAGATANAVEEFLRIALVVPGSDIAIRAQYDAGSYLMEMEQWQQAESVYRDFDQQYPDHSLAGTVAPKLAVIYQELEQWDAAAEVLTTMAENDEDPDLQRQSLYLSAELYEKAGRPWPAALAYARYVNEFPQSFELATEARMKLVQLAEARDDESARNRWLQRLINADKNAGADRTERSRYLAAYAANEFAAKEFEAFERIKLSLPIGDSLSAKRSALDQTLAAYQEVLDYGVAEFVTEANFRIGNVYSQLSRDLLDSERPDGLDPLAQEQYEILLEEQAYPFEERSVELLEANAQRAWSGLYDKWVKQSLSELAKILPARYGKQESKAEVSHGLH